MDEKVEKLITEAKKAFTTADHLAFVTYPLLKDSRLLLTIAQNVDRALTSAMNALLHVEVYYKRIQILPLDMQSRLHIFEQHTAKRYQIRKEAVEMLKEVKSVLNEHGKSPIEFVRKGRLIICSDDYQMQYLDMDRLKEYLGETRKVMARLDEVSVNV